MRPVPARYGLAILSALLPGIARLALALPPPQAPAAVPPVSIDAVVVARDGRATAIFAPQDFSVSVDGQPRRVLDVRHVSRGPGAAGAAEARVGSVPGIVFAAEQTRTILVAVDQTMLRRGDERNVTQAVGALLDRLGLEDLVAVIRLPLASGSQIEFTTDRPRARDALRAVAGQTAPLGDLAADERRGQGATDRPIAGDPDRASAGDPDRGGKPPEEVPARDAAAAMPPEDITRAQASLASLRSVLKSLQPLPGRKVLALFSSGFPEDAGLRAQVDAVAGEAAAARAAIYVFAALRLPDERQVRDFSVLDGFARRSGGAFVTLEKDPARTIDRVLPEVSACYVLRLEGAATDADGRAHALRVETARKAFMVRSAAFLVPRSDPDDPGAGNAPTPAAAGAANEPPPDDRARTESRSRPPDRDAELQTALSRIGEYVEAYQRNFSAVVAEESYLQAVPGRQIKLRSDLLLVRPEGSDAWVSFRDVYEVDGQPVRDRDERLKRLFLENPTGQALARMQAVQEESARYNIGDVLRNVNVPLFALKVVRRSNQPRFHFTLGRRADAHGVPTVRIDYEERIRPTLIRNPRTGGDVPMKGWFVIDSRTGAILESEMQATDESSRNMMPGVAQVLAVFAVRYRNDPTLGLWVPGEMTERYHTMPSSRLVMDGKATYSNFRRFQVKTEEKIAIPK